MKCNGTAYVTKGDYKGTVDEIPEGNGNVTQVTTRQRCKKSAATRMRKRKEGKRNHTKRTEPQCECANANVTYENETRQTEKANIHHHAAARKRRYKTNRNRNAAQTQRNQPNVKRTRENAGTVSPCWRRTAVRVVVLMSLTIRTQPVITQRRT